MADIFYIGQNDTADDLVRVLTKADGTVIDLTGASVEFRMRNNVSKSLVSGDCTVTNAAAGEVTYQWQEGDTAETGTYSVKFVVTYPSGQIGTVPNNGSVSVVIDQEIPSAD